VDENETDAYIGKEISTEALVGRNFYLYTGWRKVYNQPTELDLVDLDLDLDKEEEDEGEEYGDDYENSNDEFRDFIPENCWIKRFSALEDGCEAYHILAISTDNSGKIDSISVVQEMVQRMGGGFFMIPGQELQGYSSYEELDYVPGNILKELDLLLKGRYLKKDSSFIGKRLPQKMIDRGGNGGSDTEYVYALQSAYRLAYMHMTVDTEEDGTIEDFNYSTYQSSGSSYGDMFSRPMLYSDRTDEAIDMLLYIVDLYTDDEYHSFL
jgi:hypothetical protein